MRSFSAPRNNMPKGEDMSEVITSHKSYRKRGSFGNDVLDVHSLEILEHFELLEIPQSVENRGESESLP